MGKCGGFEINVGRKQVIGSTQVIDASGLAQRKFTALLFLNQS